MPSSHPFVSVFGLEFDTVVFGAGYVGYAGARVLAEAGGSTLVIEPTGQLLRESSRALENRVGLRGVCAAWDFWIESLAERGAVHDEYLDIAFAETEVACELLNHADRTRTLLYAMPVAVEADPSGIVRVQLATKSGFRTISATRWIDASEGGLLATLCGAAERRAPDDQLHSMTLHSLHWDRHESAVRDFCRENGITFCRSNRPEDRRVLWSATDVPWHRAVCDLLTRLRSATAIGDDVAVGLCSSEPLGIYREGGATPSHESLPHNLLVLSPSRNPIALESIASRFAWGTKATRNWIARFGENRKASSISAPPEVRYELTGDVVVAGTGTSGGLAALAAARQNVRVIALEFAPFPGGVGTGAGISAYFHGLEGGLQIETDRLTAEMNTVLEGARSAARRWHPDGKKLALLTLFEKHNVTFLGNSLICAIERGSDNRIAALLAATDEGMVRISAETFIDSTGDGDLCALSGTAFRSGRRGDGRSLAYSQPAFVLKTADDRITISTKNFDAGWADSTDPEDLTRARLEGVAQYWKESWAADSCPLAIAPLPGIRQSRRIITDYTVRLDDLIGHAKFADSVGEAGSIADTHSVDFEFEDDEAVFFFWVCRLFRHPLRTELPYRMLLPRDLSNVWIACRAAGVDATASYAVRMQRDMQRLGEAAGTAAALASRNGGASRGVDLDLLRRGLDSNREAAGPEPGAISRPLITDQEAENLLSSGQPGLHLWHMVRHRETSESIVRKTLDSGNADASFYSAAILAMWNESAAEGRFLRAISDRENGPPPSETNTGAFGQEIDIPFWLLAVILLRRCGTSRSYSVLGALADGPDTILNVRTALALTVEQLAARSQISWSEAVEIADALVRHPLPDHILAPSRSIWRSLRNENQITLRNDVGVDTSQDHSWQLHLIRCRIRSHAGAPPDDAARRHLEDPRANVRRVFAEVIGR